MNPEQFDGVTQLRAPGRNAALDSTDIQVTVADILANVRSRGDAAVTEYSAKFDQCNLTAFEISQVERKAALAELDKHTRADTEFAIANVRKFAEAQLATMSSLDIEMLVPTKYSVLIDTLDNSLI